MCSNVGYTQNIKVAYFAGGCFWCMEESFEKKEGVLEVVSGYSGGTTKNPTYKEVTYGNTGHFETIEIIFDKDKTNYKDLLITFGKILILLMHMVNFAIRVIVTDQ